MRLARGLFRVEDLVASPRSAPEASRAGRCRYRPWGPSCSRPTARCRRIPRRSSRRGHGRRSPARHFRRTSSSGNRRVAARGRLASASPFSFSTPCGFSPCHPARSRPLKIARNPFGGVGSAAGPTAGTASPTATKLKARVRRRRLPMVSLRFTPFVTPPRAAPTHWPPARPQYVGAHGSLSKNNTGMPLGRFHVSGPSDPE